jgi:hypothetical protein
VEHLVLVVPNPDGKSMVKCWNIEMTIKISIPEIFIIRVEILGQPVTLKSSQHPLLRDSKCFSKRKLTLDSAAQFCHPPMMLPHHPTIQCTSIHSQLQWMLGHWPLDLWPAVGSDGCS